MHNNCGQFTHQAKEKPKGCVIYFPRDWLAYLGERTFEHKVHVIIKSIIDGND